MLSPNPSLCLAILGCTAILSSQTPPSFTEFSIPTSGSAPRGIVSGPDGALWFTEYFGNKIGRISTSGVITEYPLPSPLSDPAGITSGPDGALWFVESYGNRIGRITTTGVITEYPLPTSSGTMEGIAAGPDGALWFTEFSGKIGRITTSGVITEFPIPVFSAPVGITAGPDGALWFADMDGRVGRITTAGVITLYPVPPVVGNPYGITSGPDGALWVSEYGSKIYRVTTAGQITPYLAPSCCENRYGITSGPDGALWFTNGQSNFIGRITTAGIATEYPVPTMDGTPWTITLGTDGALWFTDLQLNKIVRAISLPGGLSITGPVTLPDATAGRSYSPVQFAASGGTGGYTWSGDTGVGLSLSSDGKLSGIPGANIQGTYNFRFSVKDSSNAGVASIRRITINGNPLSITSPVSLPSGAAGTPYGSVQFLASGGTGVLSWSATGLPSGMGFNSNGVLSGTPAQGTQGSYSPQFTVTDSNNATASVVRSLTISGPFPLVIQPVFVPSGEENLLYIPVVFSATGGVGSYTWSATGLPAGMVFGPGPVLSGKPTAGSRGVYNPQFTVKDAANATASITRTLTINPETLQVTGPLTLTAGTAGIPYGPVQFSASGGAGGYTWTATQLPAGMSFSSTGVLSGTPAVTSQGSYVPQITVRDSSNASSLATRFLLINPPALPAPSISSISPNPAPGMNGSQTLTINGTGFQNSSGLRVHVAGTNFSADFTGPQVNFISSSQLTVSMNLGTAAVNRTVQIFNPDGQSSNLFSFSVTAQPVNTLLALPQIAFGGGWYTALYLSNTNTTAATVPVNFIGENGSPLSVPLIGIGSVSSRSISLNPGATAILEAPNAGPLVQGWAEASLPPGVVGYAVFRQSVSGRADQEAVVPLTPESSQTADFAYDDTSSTTSVALVNPSNQQTAATITLYQSDGILIGSSQLVLSPRAKQAIALRNLPGLSGAAGKRGWATFNVATGAISVLGLRFGTQAFTSIPVSHRTGTVASTSVLAIPQIAYGGGWYTALYFSNTTSSAVSLPVSFVAENGGPLSVPLLGSGPASSRIINLNPGATAVLEAPNTGDLVQGWGEAILPPGVIGYAVFRQSVAERADQEAVVPLTSESKQTADLVYDDTTLTTSTAFVNPGNQEITVAITVRDPNGSQIGSGQVILPARSKRAAVLKTLPGLAAAGGQRGLAHYSVTSGAISVLGLRFGGEAFTSIPGSQ